jgi:hypothetical protein
VAKTLLNLSQAAQAAGITRRTLYNHVKQGKVTVSRDGKNNPVVDVSELIRVYGNVNLPEKQIPSVSHRENTQKNFPHEQLTAMQKELAEMKQAITLMLEDKTLREKENQQHEDEKNQLREEIKKLSESLEQAQKRVLVQAVQLTHSGVIPPLLQLWPLRLWRFLVLQRPFMCLPLLDGVHLTDKRRSCSLKLCTCLLKSDTRSLSAAFSRCVMPNILCNSEEAASHALSCCA